MKTIEIRLYTAQELKDGHPAAFNRALEHYRDTWCNQDIPWSDETVDSLKEIIKDAGLRLKDWSLGAYNRGNFISVEFSQDEAGELTGKRAFAWLENNLLAKYRIPFVPMNTSAERKRFVKYGDGYRPGLIAPCPATGVCTDEDYLDALRTRLRKGDTLKEAFESLADVCETLLESDDAANRSEDSFLDNADANEWEFTQDGKRY